MGLVGHNRDAVASRLTHCQRDVELAVLVYLGSERHVVDHLRLAVLGPYGHFLLECELVAGHVGVTELPVIEQPLVLSGGEQGGEAHGQRVTAPLVQCLPVVVRAGPVLQRVVRLAGGLIPGPLIDVCCGISAGDGAGRGARYQV